MRKKRTLAELDAEIAACEGRMSKAMVALRALKRERRAIVGGRASGKARKNEKRDATIIAEYQAIKASDESPYGKVAALAREYGLSKRQLFRVVRR